MGDCNATLSIAGRVMGDDVDTLLELLWCENFLYLESEEGDRTEALLKQLRDARNAQGVLDLYAEDVDGDIPEEILDTLQGMGLSVRWSWTSDGNFGPGFDVWDVATGKGQRFWCDTEGHTLVPYHKLKDPGYMAHIEHFLDINRAVCQSPLLIGRSAHDLLADEAAIQRSTADAA